MQNTLDIMAMVQNTSMVKQKFDSPGKAFGVEKASFKKELLDARKESFADKKAAQKSPADLRRSLEKKAEQLAKVMANNNSKAEVKESRDFRDVEEPANTAGQKEAADKASNEKSDKVKSPSKADESTQAVLEMLQKLMQILNGMQQGEALEGQAAVEEEALLGALTDNDQMPSALSENQTEELQAILKQLQSELSKLAEQSTHAGEQDYSLKKLAQLVDKLMNKQEEKHQKLHETGETKETLQAVTELSRRLMRGAGTQAENSVNADETAMEDAVQTSIAAAEKSEGKSSEDNQGRSQYKSESGNITKLSQGADAPQSQENKDYVILQDNGQKFQINLKQADSSLQTEKLISINKSEIVNQVVKKADIIIQEGRQEMIMKLEPESLGKLNLKIVVEKGLITAKFIAESQQVKEVLESSMNQLKNALQEKGIAVQAMSVSVGQQGREFQSQQGFEQWKRSIKLGSKVSGDYLELEDDAVQNINPYTYHDGKVDFKA